MESSRGEQAPGRLTIRPLERGDYASLSQIYRDVFHVTRDADYWEWKYYRNPAGEHLMVGAVDPRTGRVVGQTGTVPVRMTLGGNRVLGAQACDIVVLPEYRTAGTFLRLHDAHTRLLEQRGVKVIYGFAVPDTRKISLSVLKFKDVSPVDRWVRVLDPTSFLEKKTTIPGAAKLLGKVSGVLLRVGRGTATRLPSGFHLREAASFDQGYDALASARSQETGILRDATYLNWRYRTCPLFAYQAFEVRSGQGLAGFCVVSVQDEEIRRAYLMDLVYPPDQPQVRDALLARAVRYAYDFRAATINGWCLPGHSLQEAFAAKGFVLKETSQELIARSHDPATSTAALAQADRWDISLGDSDYH